MIEAGFVGTWRVTGVPRRETWTAGRRAKCPGGVRGVCRGSTAPVAGTTCVTRCVSAEAVCTVVPSVSATAFAAVSTTGDFGTATVGTAFTAEWVTVVAVETTEDAGTEAAGTETPAA